MALEVVTNASSEEKEIEFFASLSLEAGKRKVELHGPLTRKGISLRGTLFWEGTGVRTLGHIGSKTITMNQRGLTFAHGKMVCYGFTQVKIPEGVQRDQRGAEVGRYEGVYAIEGLRGEYKASLRLYTRV